MSNTQQLPPRMFNLEGIFLGCLGERPNKVKSIMIDVEQEQIAIKLPKALRMTLREYQLQPGSRIRCIGRSEIDLKAGVIKLKAYQLFPLPPHSDDSARAILPADPFAASISTTVASPRDLLGGLPVSTKQKRAKILVCRKSGCQKRGGHQLVTQLERILQAHQLDDQVKIEYTGCQKRCSKAPTLTIMPGKHRYDRQNLKSLPTLIEKHFCAPRSGSFPSPVEPR